MNLLRLEQISKSFGGVKAVNDVTIGFETGKVFAIIGPNGAGKTTILNLINGFAKPDIGRVLFKDEDISGYQPHKIAALGVGRLFQSTRLFPKMKVLDNILAVRKYSGEENPIASLLSMYLNRKKEQSYAKEAKESLNNFGLQNMQDSFTEDISFGQERLISLLRLFTADFEVFLLDEPFSGVAPQLRDIIFKEIKDLASAGKLVIVVEHEMEAVRKVADFVFFMNDGEIEKRGKPQEVLDDYEVVKQYIGLCPSGRVTMAPNDSTSVRVLIRTEDLHVAYYKREILKGVGISIGEREIVGLIGPNGAGKSTLLKALAGVVPAKKGKVYYNDKNGQSIMDITNSTVRQRVRMGVGYFMQGGEVFSDLTTEENLEVGAMDMGKQDIENHKAMVYGLFPVLWEKKKQRAGLLSGGQRQMLALAMVLMKNGRSCLLLDEPSAGLSPRYQRDMLSKIREIRDKYSTSIFLVEQRVGELRDNVDRLYIMKMGEIVKEAFPWTLNEEELKAIFVGDPVVEPR